MPAHFDNVLDKIGGWGPYQVYYYILIGIAGLCAGMQNMANVFLLGEPDHWCHVTELANHSVADQKALLTPLESEHEDKSCFVNSLNYTDAYWRMSQNMTFLTNHTRLIPCSRWDYENTFGRTVVTEWDLVCSRAWMKALANSVYMLGFLIGTISFGTLADRVGRKPSWMIAMVMLIVTGSTAAFMPEYWSHIFLRMASGVAAAGTFTCGFVIVMEIIGVEKRMIPGMFYQGFFALGYMILPGIAYATKDYVWLNFIISAYCVIYLPYYWLIGESPRWLLTTGRRDRAEKEIKKAAKMNGKPFTQDILQDDTLLESKEECALNDGVDHRKYHIGDLMRTPNMRKKTFNVYFNWFVNSFVYYGLSLGVTDLAGSPYLNLFLSGLMEFPGIAIAVLTLDRVGRRWPLAILLALGGVSCIIFNFIPYEWRVISTTLAMMGKLCISGSFAIIYVFSAELFPTVVRNIGVGSGSMSARLGGLTAPFVAELGIFWKALPMFIFGGSAILAGILSLLLPETLHQTLPETLEEGEHFGSDAWSKFCHMPRRIKKIQPNRKEEESVTSYVYKDPKPTASHLKH